MDDKKYLDEELVEVKLRDYFNYEYKAGTPIKDLIHEIENIVRNIKSSNVEEKIYAEWLLVDGICSCTNCKTSMKLMNGDILDLSYLPRCPICGAYMNTGGDR